MRTLSLCVLFTLAARVTMACSCAGVPVVEGSFKMADAVFAGVVETIEDPSGDRLRRMSETQRQAAPRAAPSELGPDFGRRVTLRVLQWWKGEQLSERVQVWTAYGGGDCGYPFETDQSYLVFAHRWRDLLTVGICSKTGPLVCAERDMEWLGEPIKTYEKWDRKQLIAREQPYTTYWRPCVQEPLLIGERGLEMIRRCAFAVDAVVSREGVVSSLRFEDGQRDELIARDCPASLEDKIRAAVRQWRFHPATIDGEPVEVRFTRISPTEPTTEAEHAASLKEESERRAKAAAQATPPPLNQ